MCKRELCYAACITIAVHGAIVGWAWQKTSPKLATTSVLYVQAEIMSPMRVDESTHVAPNDYGLVSTTASSAPKFVGRSTLLSPQTAYVSPKHLDLPPEPIGYLPSEAVDQEAMPLGDWAINTARLPPGRALRVMLKLWISSTGVVDQWELSGVPEDERALAQHALADVSKTLFQPAFLNTKPVPNFRQLELVLSY